MCAKSKMAGEARHINLVACPYTPAVIPAICLPPPPLRRPCCPSCVKQRTMANGIWREDQRGGIVDNQVLYKNLLFFDNILNPKNDSWINDNGAPITLRMPIYFVRFVNSRPNASSKKPNKAPYKQAREQIDIPPAQPKRNIRFPSAVLSIKKLFRLSSRKGFIS